MPGRIFLKLIYIHLVWETSFVQTQILTSVKSEWYKQKKMKLNLIYVPVFKLNVN